MFTVTRRPKGGGNSPPSFVGKLEPGDVVVKRSSRRRVYKSDDDRDVKTSAFSQFDFADIDPEFAEVVAVKKEVRRKANLPYPEHWVIHPYDPDPWATFEALVKDAKEASQKSIRTRAKTRAAHGIMWAEYYKAKRKYDKGERDKEPIVPGPFRPPTGRQVEALAQLLGIGHPSILLTFVEQANGLPCGTGLNVEKGTGVMFMSRGHWARAITVAKSDAKCRGLVSHAWR